MVVCRYFQQGNCRFGQNCKFDHPGAPSSRNPFENRFSALGSGPSSSHVSGGGGYQQQGGGLNGRFSQPRAANGANSSEAQAPYAVTADSITRDLTIETPQWILSSYGPGKDAPEQLFGGFPREQSFEEVRLHHWNGAQSGNEAQALREIAEIHQSAERQMSNALSNVDQAIQFILSAANKHPNRHDVCKQTITPPTNRFARGAAPVSAFGQPQQAAAPANRGPFSGPAFGQPSQPQSTFAKPAFGQPSQPTSTFGRPSQPTSAFGQPQQQNPTFGQPSQPSAFGQPSALGARAGAFGAPAFGQPSQPQGGLQSGASAFGQPSALGQKPSPFAAANSPFGTGGGGGGFASQNQQGQQNQNQNPFGAQPQGGNPFGQQQQQKQPGPNPFSSGQQTQQGGFSAFSQQQQQGGFAQQQTQRTNAFASNAPNGFASQAGGFSSAPSQPAQPTGTTGTGTSSPYGPDSQRQHPDVASYAQRGMNNQLTRFKGQHVTYRGDKPGVQGFDGTWRQIWFPNGPPVYYKDTELPADAYTDKQRGEWQAFLHKGEFDGLVPEVAPMREVCAWDF